MKYSKPISQVSKPHLFGIMQEGSHNTKLLNDADVAQAARGAQVNIDGAKARIDRMLPAAAHIVYAPRLA